MQFYRAHPGPWYTVPVGISTTVFDISGRRIAEVCPDETRPDREAATARLIKLAPTVLQSLKMAVAAMKDDVHHQDMVRHLTRTLEAVEPERIRRRRAGAA